MYGKKRPKWLIEKLIENNKGRIKSKREKLIRLIKLQNRQEVLISKDEESYYCFSLSHAAKIIGVTFQSISKGIKKNRKVKGWDILFINLMYY